MDVLWQSGKKAGGMCVKLDKSSSPTTKSPEIIPQKYYKVISSHFGANFVDFYNFFLLFIWKCSVYFFGFCVELSIQFLDICVICSWYFVNLVLAISGSHTAHRHTSLTISHQHQSKHNPSNILKFMLFMFSHNIMASFFNVDVGREGSELTMSFYEKLYSIWFNYRFIPNYWSF